ncbi:type I polyketide synthase [Dactylosporangium sp. CA-139114]|uniref:type I polyketide synthase n=1 Tax=Dactylosporangium sp. CA-139114 TaxID=3239931 RepID=UPI003D9736D2
MADEEKLREYLARVIAELQQTRQRLRDLSEPELDPVAIVGMGCRYPGGVTSPEDLWELVATGRDAISGFPADRGWDARLGHGTGYGLDAGYAPLGGFLDAPGGFDAALFGVSPREATAMDPQQRLLLEVAWEALERSGIAPLSLRGSRSGVFIGTSGQDYAALLQQAAAGVEGYLLTGTAASVVSGRLAYSFGLEGPAVTVDTACSSSTVAIHLACQALRERECTLALAGGATVMATPGAFVEFSYQRGLAADGRCKSFAAAADGTGWSEGVGVLVLERLADARRLGHRVLGVIRGSAVNQDGASNGLTAPNGPSQQRVIRQALATARLTPDEVDAVEAHGTGTTLGDPIEAQALLATYGQERPADAPLWLGSIKSNIGHSQAAAGVAGIIKMVMAMRHGVLPKTLHVDEPTPHVDWAAGAVSLLTEARPWPAVDRPRRAAVSSFGMSGTNTHVILEQPEPRPEEEPAPDARPAGGPVPVLVSGRSAAALTAVAGSWSRWLAAHPEAEPGDVAWASIASRSVLEHRAVVLAERREELVERLRDLSGGVVGLAAPDRRVGVLFSGQGAQRAGMGAGLDFPVFQRVYAEVCAHFGALPDERIDETEITQPALFAIEVALYEQLKAWGLQPSVVGGHSIGELVAAYVAGVWSLDDACKVVAARARLMQALPAGGGMLAVAAPVEDVPEGVSVAAINGPNAWVLSGPAELLPEFPGVRTSRLRVSHAFHSALMEPMLDEFRAVLDTVTFHAPQLPIVSNVTGGLITEFDADYWVRHVRGTVLFADDVAAMREAGVDTFLEVGPDSVLVPHLPSDDAVVVGTLRRDRDERESLLRAVAGLYVAGVDVDWAAVLGGAGRAVDLPTYPFQEQRYWPEPGTAEPADQPSAADARFWSAVEREELAGLAATLHADDAAEESLRVVVPLLSSWRRRQRDRSLIDSWRYKISWTPIANPAATDLAGRWLVVVPPGTDGGDVAAALRDGGADVEIVPSVEAVEAVEAAADGEPVRGIVSLLALDREGGLLANLALSQTPGEARLWFVTRGAVAAGPYDRDIDPAQAATWGLGRVVGLEAPQRWGGLIDLPPHADTDTWAKLRAVLAGTSDEDQLAIRPAGVFVRRLVRAEIGGNPAARPWTPSGTVLITGGLGALGRHLGRWLAAEGAAHLVLLGRRGLDTPGAEQHAAELRDLGVRVTVAAVDVADARALAALVEGVEAGGDRITAVVHTAGRSQTTPLADVTAAEFAAVAAGKADGATNLARVFAERELDAFIVYSSIAGTWGSAGQSAYAAANAHLDALVEQRRRAGKPGTAIAWGPWAAGGMAGESGSDGDTTEEQLRRRGVPGLDPALAIAALRQAVEHGDACVTIADVDWRRFAPTFAATRPRPLLRGVAEAARAMDAGDPIGADLADEAVSLRAGLASLDTAARLDVLTTLVRDLAAAVLGHADATDLPETGTFRDCGFDSLTAVELRNRLSAAVGLRLATTLVFDYPTPRALADHLLTVLLPGEAQGPAAVAGPADGLGEEIAIVAMSCRYPGGVTSPEDLWRVVDGGVDVMSDFPADRGWDLGRLYDPDPERAGTFYATAGGFLDGAAAFDAGFFGISPREALAMDPQQRLLLEASWEAVERAGVDPQGLRGAPVGVFVGTNGQDYGALLMGAVDDTGGFAGTGNAASVVSGRVAYALGLEGPAVSVDTACSSSLVALHLAVQSLRRGECDLALAGGVTIMATPGLLVEFSRQRGLSEDGRCKAFAAAADGTGWSEGVGVLLVERLADARRNGHPVLALVAGSAVNQDGASNGLTAPNGPSQQRVIRQALADAGLAPCDVDVVEAHGTGTTLGDPIEAQALLATYGQDRGEPLLLGSIKSNIGHTQAAAGVAGIIKMVLAMRAGVVPATLHVDAPTPHVDWSAGKVELATGARPWPSTGRRRAGVSSFGISGTNAHVILALPDETPGETPETSGLVIGPVVWPISGRSAAAVAEQAARLADIAHTASPERIAWSLATTRAVFDHRAATVGRTTEELLAPVEITGAADGGRMVWVFPGQGGQSAGMAAGLFSSCPVFADAILECQLALAPWLDVDIAGLLTGDDTDWLDRVEIVQPVLFAVGVALSRVWLHAGVKPHAVIGHSQGEIVAAHVAGMLSLDDAARVVAVRARALKALKGTGTMASVPLTVDEVPDDVVVAAVNGPRTLVVAGEPDAVQRLVDRVEGARLIPVDYASHHPSVERVRGQVLADLAGITIQPGHTPMISTVAGATMSAEYWMDNLRQRVEFESAVRTALESGHRTFVEISAHPVLTMALTQIVDDAHVLDTLRRDADQPTRLLTNLAKAWVLGHPVAWNRVLGRTAIVDLPTYPFQRQRFWPSITAPQHTASDGLGAVRLAGEDGLVVTERLGVTIQPWLADHRVGGTVIVPGTALLDLVLRAGEQLAADRVAELTLAAPVALPETGAVRVQVRVGAPDESGLRPVTIHSQPDGPLDAPWTRHADGLVAPAGPATTGGATGAWPPAGAEPIPFQPAEWYAAMAERGLAYGPAFRGLERVWRHGDELLAEVALPDPDADTERFGLHPALLDAALQATALGGFFGEAEGRAYMPFAWAGVDLYAQGATRLRVRLAPAGDDAVRISVDDQHGEPVAAVASLAFRPAAGAGAAAEADGESLYQIDWIETTATEHTLDRRPLPELVAAIAAGEPAPDAVIADITGTDPLRTTAETAALLQAWLAEPALDAARLVLRTRGAIAVDGAEAVPDLAAAPVWGLVRSAQSEHPGRFVLLDTDGSAEDRLSGDEPQLAVRRGALLVPRLARAGRHGTVVLPETGALPWRLDVGEQNSLDSLVVRPAPEAAAPLGPTQVRVELRASGVNLRDVVLTLGMVPDQHVLGNEGAGVVAEVGAEVTGFAPGDAVLGIFSGSFASTAVTEARLLAHKPAAWSYTEAATVPVAFLTAYYGLVDVANVRPGESVLIHSAAGGVGLAAVQLAKHLGATLFGTASPGKWPALRATGIALASSRTLDFEDAFRERTGGRGVDVVLNGLTGGFVDASLRLLAEGGRFVELGKTDKRPPQDVEREHPGVRYRAFDLIEAGYDRIGAMLTELMDLFARGVLRPLPVRAWDVRQAPEALRFLSQARQIGKIAVTVPRPIDPDGTILIAGGTGTLGALLARHLVRRHGARRLLLASRRGLDADGAVDLAAQLKAAGCEVTVAAADLTDADAVDELVSGVDPAAPLTAVIVATGVLDDAVIESLTAERIAAVLRAKADPARHLHHATRGTDLAAFVLFSAAAGVLGGPGQGNYAAANTYLDALAHDRRAHGHPATSLAWGRWEQASGMTGHLAAGDVRRLARAGVDALATAEALDLFDRALRSGRPLLVPTRLAAGPGPGPVPPLLSGLFRPARRTVAAGGAQQAADGLRTRLEAMPDDQRGPAVLALVCAHVAVVLGHPDPAGIDPGRAFRELGFDSLTAVELRNRLGAATGLRLAATVVFDHPTPNVLAEHLLAQLVTAAPTAGQRAADQLDRLEALLAGLDPADDGFTAVTERLGALLSRLTDRRDPGAEDDDDLDRATAENIFDLIDRELETQ